MPEDGEMHEFTQLKLDTMQLKMIAEKRASGKMYGKVMDFQK